MKVVAWLCAAVVSLSAFAAQAAGKDDTFPIDQVLGKADAPVTIVEYASTTCGHCANFHKTTLPEVKKNWIDTGKAKLVYRDFPTGPAGLSIGASMIAHCAGPERYFGVLGLIMENQDKWLGSKDPLDTLKKTVRLAGLTGADVDACLQRQDLFEGIQKRAEHGNEVFKVDSTPSFLINGKLVVGALPYAEFNKVLTEAAK
ncbi:thioredoxin domain-containing protein [Magnetospirillum sp. 64-120]|uniref:thioredoxin domain-containing protein n=1 Tax=Magnetospirillum sp. 64-120 TaxID=1895778 RepID=UPI000925C464|nr:thioredoxin domain-containing protein [Magnetospirillum sp. 64-120]OJX79915.1 MAG: protein-disulfide isomerase [Magnetospirillum sp. 64-120]